MQKGRLYRRPFLISKTCLVSRLVQDRCPTAYVRRLVAEEHVAVRCRAAALGRCSSLSCARSSSKQGDGGDQGGKNAFHGVTPLQRLVRDLGRSMEWKIAIQHSPKNTEDKKMFFQKMK